jgi:hypothetical protein
MIDYLFSYPDAGAAKRAYDALCTALGLPVGDDYRRQSTIDNVKVWRPSDDTTEMVGDPPTTRVVHTYLQGYWVLIAADKAEPVLADDMALEFALDRDACNAGQPFIVGNNIGEEINDIAFEPMFAGSNYPVGGYA